MHGCPLEIEGEVDENLLLMCERGRPDEITQFSSVCLRLLVNLGSKSISRSYVSLLRLEIRRRLPPWFNFNACRVQLILQAILYIPICIVQREEEKAMKLGAKGAVEVGNVLRICAAVVVTTITTDSITLGAPSHGIAMVQFI